MGRRELISIVGLVKLVRCGVFLTWIKSCKEVLASDSRLLDERLGLGWKCETIQEGLLNGV